MAACDLSLSLTLSHAMACLLSLPHLVSHILSLRHGRHVLSLTISHAAGYNRLLVISTLLLSFVISTRLVSQIQWPLDSYLSLSLRYVSHATARLSSRQSCNSPLVISTRLVSHTSCHSDTIVACCRASCRSCLMSLRSDSRFLPSHRHLTPSAFYLALSPDTIRSGG